MTSSISPSPRPHHASSQPGCVCTGLPALSRLRECRGRADSEHSVPHRGRVYPGPRRSQCGSPRSGVQRVDADILARVRWNCPAARELASAASKLSDSGLESEFVQLMRGAGVAVRQQVWIDGHPVDGLIGERLIVQLDGFAHHQAADRRRDLRADARLALRGYTVLRFDYQQVLFNAPYVIDTVQTAIAQRPPPGPLTRPGQAIRPAQDPRRQDDPDLAGSPEQGGCRAAPSRAQPKRAAASSQR